MHKISIVSRGSALGITWFLPEEERYTTSKQKFLDEICGLLGGRAAEEIIFGDITTGASNDIERASLIARNMATRFGMGAELGLVTYGEQRGSASLGVDLGAARNYSEQTAHQIDEFVRAIIAEQYERAKGYITKFKEKLEQLHAILLKKETMTVEEFIEIFEGKKSAEKALEEVEEEEAKRLKEAEEEGRE